MLSCYRHAAIGAICLIVFALGAYFLIGKEKTPFENAVTTDSEQVAEIRDLIANLGPERAYEAVLEKAKTVSITEHHALGHDYGRAAAQSGVDPEITLSTCGTELVYGCLHEAIGQLLSIHGLDYLNELERLCYQKPGLKSYLACIHGLGHGLLTYVGYHEETLFDVIKYCDDVFLGEALMGCQGGVFMEYNQRLLIGGPSREISPENPYTPCVDQGIYTRVCAFWLPQLWQQSVPDAEILMNWCMHFPGTNEDKKACYEGLGAAMVATSTESYTFTAATCDRVSKASEDASFACRWRALRDHSHIDEHNFGTSEVRCIGFSGEKYNRCAEYVKEKVASSNALVEQLRLKKELMYEE